MSEFADPAQHGGKRILIVEDDAIVAKVYQRRLTKSGFRVSVANDGGEGFFSIIKDRPDAVLLDLMLPQMDGLEILRKTRAQKQFERTPIIVFSNAFMNGMLQEAAECGATMTVNKSDANAIESIVEAFLQFLCRAPQTFQLTPRPAPIAVEETVESARASTEVKNSSERVQQAPKQPPATNATPIPGVSGRRFGVFPVLRNRNKPTTAGADHEEATNPVVNRLARGNFGSAVRASRLLPNEPVETEEEDRSAERNILEVFFNGGTETVADVRNALRDYQKGPATSEGRKHLEAFYRHVHRLTGIAAMCSSEAISNFSASVEALLHELLTRPDSFRPSTLKTLAMAVDVLDQMFKEAGRYECPMINQAIVLVVDEHFDSQREISASLEKARLHAVCASNAEAALHQMREVLFELIFLEAEMSHADGFELCSTIREMPGYEKTPIVFVTGLNDFQSRARSVASGGNEFISKPICRIEMTVKALTFVMKGRMAGARLNTPQIPA
jgi:CheY-like chemotaxis protein